MELNDEGVTAGLHDALLVNITIDWLGAAVELVFDPELPKTEKVVIRVTGLVELICPHREPWGTNGHAAWVNQVRIVRHEGKEACLEVLMSGGDLISMKCAFILREESHSQ